MQVLEQRLAGIFAAASRAALSAYVNRLAASVGPPPQLPAAAKAALHRGTRMPQAADSRSHAAGSGACVDPKQLGLEETLPDGRTPRSGTQPQINGNSAGGLPRAVAVTLGVQQLAGRVRVTLVAACGSPRAGQKKLLDAGSAGACTPVQSCRSQTATEAALPHPTTPLSPGATGSAARAAAPGLRGSHVPASWPPATRPAPCGLGGRPVAAASAWQPLPKAELMEMLEDGLGPDATHAQLPDQQPASPPADSPCKPEPAARAAAARPQLPIASRPPTQRMPCRQSLPVLEALAAHAPPCQKLLLPVRGAGPPARARGAAYQAPGFLIKRQRQPTLLRAAPGLLRPPPPASRRNALEPAAAAALGKGYVARFKLHDELAASSAAAVGPSAVPVQQLDCSLVERAAPSASRAVLLPGRPGFCGAAPAGSRRDAVSEPCAEAVTSVGGMHAVCESSGASSGGQAARASNAPKAHTAGKSCIAGSACPAASKHMVPAAAATARAQAQRGQEGAPGRLPGAAALAKLQLAPPDALECDSRAAADAASSAAHAFDTLHAAGQQGYGSPRACAGALPVLPAPTPGQHRPEPVCIVHTPSMGQVEHERALSAFAGSGDTLEAACSIAASQGALAEGISAAARQPAGALALAAAASAAAGALRTAAGPFPWPTYFIGTRDSFTHRLVPRRSQVRCLMSLHARTIALVKMRLALSLCSVCDTNVTRGCVLQETEGGRSYVRTDYFFCAGDAPDNYAAVRHP